MKLAIISDLHIGDKTATDLFGHTEEEFLSFLLYLETHFDKIVLLGDIFECLSSNWPFNKQNQLFKTIKSYPKISNKFLNNKMYLYIPGNHDHVACDVFGFEDNSVIFSNNRLKILFKHGHQFDWIVSMAPMFCELMAWVANWMLRIGLKPLYDYIIKTERRFHDDCKSVTPYHKKAIAAAKRVKAKIVVVGHTHVLRRLEHDGVTYANCGTCSRGNINFVGLDTETGAVTLNAWYNNHPHIR